jgi:hypothetical protein
MLLCGSGLALLRLLLGPQPEVCFTVIARSSHEFFRNSFRQLDAGSGLSRLKGVLTLTTLDAIVDDPNRFRWIVDRVLHFPVVLF